MAELEELVRRFDIQYTGFPDDLFTCRAYLASLSGGRKN